MRLLWSITVSLRIFWTSIFFAPLRRAACRDEVATLKTASETVYTGDAIRSGHHLSTDTYFVWTQLIAMDVFRNPVQVDPLLEMSVIYTR